MVAMATQTPELPQPRLGVPSRNPLPLSASQESQVRDIYYARVRKLCADEIKGMLTYIGNSFNSFFFFFLLHRYELVVKVA